MCTQISASQKEFFAEGDAQTIQNAVDYAKKTGTNRVVIPRFNARTGENIWNIEKAVLLPSDITIIIEDAHLRLCEGIFDNIFRNENCLTTKGNTMAGEQHNINIIGSGNALLDGGLHNGLVEQMHRDNPEKYPRLSVNLLIFLHNVRDFRISGLYIKESRWWSICCIYCRYGKISDIDFEMHATSENQDGIDLRIGCEYITIENITGMTGDDTVALTALPFDDLVPETALHVEGKSFDIHDVNIRNITSSTHGCYLIRFLCEDGAKEYNITVENVHDTGKTISGAVITFGMANTYFVKDHPRRMGDFRNVTLRNISTNAQRGIVFNEPMQDVFLENFQTYGRNEVGVTFTRSFSCDNVVLRNVSLRSNEDTFNAAINSTKDFLPEELKGLRFENIRVGKPGYLYRRYNFDIKDIVYDGVSEGIFSGDSATLDSAYGRYHKFSLGQEITNRPKDSRVDAKK